MPRESRKRQLAEQLEALGLKVPSRAKIADLEAMLNAEQQRRAVVDPPAEPEAKNVAEVVDDEPAETDAAPETEPSTDVAVVEQPSTLPELSKWEQMSQMSVVLARTELVQPALRGKPDDVLLVLLASHDLGITATQGLQKLFVIDGKVSMSAELMAALVHARGHELWAPEPPNEERAVVSCRRRGSDHVSTVEWTIEQARAAGLADKSNWKKYKPAMLWARAVSQITRMVCPDVLAGVSYTPEELGAITDADGSVIEASSRPSEQPRDGDEPASDAAIAAVKQQLADLDEPTKSELRERWVAQEVPRLNPPAGYYVSVDNLKTIENFIAAELPDIENAFVEGRADTAGGSDAVTLVPCSKCNTAVAESALTDVGDGKRLCEQCAAEPF